ncbi:unnamed protein product [Ectocarpus sp. CCAP 1310/34]|nr:unnamed protein product [Ectocarpus sp. CCAP 1310/34]
MTEGVASWVLLDSIYGRSLVVFPRCCMYHVSDLLIECWTIATWRTLSSQPSVA